MGNREDTVNLIGYSKDKVQDSIYLKGIPVAVDLDGRVLTSMAADDSASIDAFGRLRVSSPQNLFDSKLIFDDPDIASNLENSPLFFDNQQISGSGTSTLYNANESSQTLSVSSSTAGTRVRQSKMRFNYQPGKSHLILMTFNMHGVQSGITKREGYFDDKNGIFLQLLGTEISFVIRTYTSGSAVDTSKVLKADWNIDKFDGTGPSRKILDLTKTQILFIDFEWLGVGRVRVGFVIDGHIYYAHEFNHANTLTLAYMSTPNLPLRSEISNSGTGVASSLTQICSSVISEGGSEDLGIIRYASTGGTQVACNVENTVYAIIGIKLKSEYIGASIKVLNVALQEQVGSKQLEWKLILNPTVAGVFTYNSQPQSGVSIALGATSNTVTGGYDMDGGWFSSAGVQGGNSGNLGKAINNALLLGSTIAGVTDTLVLCARPVAGSANCQVEGSITYRELV